MYRCIHVDHFVDNVFFFLIASLTTENIWFHRGYEFLLFLFLLFTFLSLRSSNALLKRLNDTAKDWGERVGNSKIILFGSLSETNHFVLTLLSLTDVFEGIPGAVHLRKEESETGKVIDIEYQYCAEYVREDPNNEN